jgi:hypothetical protein
MLAGPSFRHSCFASEAQVTSKTRTPTCAEWCKTISLNSMKLPYRIVITTLVAALALPIAAQAAKGERKKKEPAPSFATADKDGDGKISETEFAAANEKLGAEAAKTQFGQLDKDHDGKLSKDEFASGGKRGERKKPRKKKSEG